MNTRQKAEQIAAEWNTELGEERNRRYDERYNSPIGQAHRHFAFMARPNDNETAEMVDILLTAIPRIDDEYRVGITFWDWGMRKFCVQLSGMDEQRAIVKELFRRFEDDTDELDHWLFHFTYHWGMSPLDSRKMSIETARAFITPKPSVWQRLVSFIALKKNA